MLLKAAKFVDGNPFGNDTMFPKYDYKDIIRNLASIDERNLDGYGIIDFEKDDVSQEVELRKIMLSKEEDCNIKKELIKILAILNQILSDIGDGESITYECYK